jgi:DNA-binding GntR family transcriptional regulator
VRPQGLEAHYPQVGPRNLCEEQQRGQTSSRFNPLRALDGGPILGQYKTGKVEVGPVKDQECAALMLKAGAQIARFHRIRFLGRRPFAYELECTLVQHFPCFALQREIPNELEELAPSSEPLMARAEAKVRAMPCPPATTAALRDGAVALSVQQLAFNTHDLPSR